jgi:hypothetical protein
MNSYRCLSLTIGLLTIAGTLGAQNQPQPPGRSVGTVTTNGDLIILELDAGAIASPNLFDLGGRTLRFTPDRAGYRAQSIPVQWDADFGAELKQANVTLKNFSFPYSGKSWDSFVVGQTGTINFGVTPPQGGGRGGGGGSTVGRFAELRVAASTLINTNPAINVFLKPRVSGPRYVKELSDRVVVTWNLTEASAGVFDFTWVPTVNRFQAVLRKDGGIDLSYDQVVVKDAIVGLYPTVTAGTERRAASFDDPEDPAVPAHLDIRKVTASVVDGLFLKITFEARGPILPEGDAQLGGITYRVAFDFDAPFAASAEGPDTDVVWTIRGTTGGRGGGGGGRGGGAPRYATSGIGASADAKIEGNTISIVGTLPKAFRAGGQVGLSADVMAPGTPPATVDQLQPSVARLSGLRSPEIDLSGVNRRSGPFTVVYEAFHHAGLPRPADMACSVIKALGDRFDFFAWYSDFRVDNQEAGTPATGPMDNSVTGFRTGGGGRGPESFCSAGRLQSTFIQPVYIGSNQGMERSPDGSMNGYNLAMSQIGHELGHRWAAFASATVNGETFPLGPTHWTRGLHVPAAFPYRRPVEASAMGGGAWQDNNDGTFTQLDDDFYVPANGYSHLDLYFMGIIPASEVPDFFILRNLVAAGKDAKGNPLYRGDKVTITIQDVITANGPRMPAYEQARKAFNTGIVAIVMKGVTPSRELIERSNGIRQAWIDYWSKTTGGRSTMTVSPTDTTK